MLAQDTSAPDVLSNVVKAVRFPVKLPMGEVSLAELPLPLDELPLDELPLDELSLDGLDELVSFMARALHSESSTISPICAFLLSRLQSISPPIKLFPEHFSSM